MFEITWQEVQRDQHELRRQEVRRPEARRQEADRPETAGGRKGERPREAAPARRKPAPKARAVQAPIAETPSPGLEIPRAVAPPLVLGTRLLSIRVPFKSAIVSCAICSKAFSAHGPTGFCEEQPICDRCLLEQENQLGMLLALSIFTRAYAVLADREERIASEAAVEMLSFARIYELFAARFGPARPLDFSAISVVGTIS